MKNFFKRHPIRATIEALFLFASYSYIGYNFSAFDLFSFFETIGLLAFFMVLPVIIVAVSPLLLVILVNTIISLFQSEESIREEYTNSSTPK